MELDLHTRWPVARRLPAARDVGRPIGPPPQPSTAATATARPPATGGIPWPVQRCLTRPRRATTQPRLWWRWHRRCQRHAAATHGGRAVADGGGGNGSAGSGSDIGGGRAGGDGGAGGLRRPYGKCRIKKAPLRGVRNSRNPTRLEIEGETEASSSLA